jgi:hypothetical protein
MDCFVASLLAMTEEFPTASFRGDAEASNPESRDSGSGANAPSRNDSFPDCCAEPVIGRRFAPTRWLAMTASAALEGRRRGSVILRGSQVSGAIAPPSAPPAMSALRSRGDDTVAVIARSASDEAIHFSVCGAMDCFAEPVIGRRFAPTRWLAMTETAFAQAA